MNSDLRKRFIQLARDAESLSIDLATDLAERGVKVPSTELLAVAQSSKSLEAALTVKHGEELK